MKERRCPFCQLAKIQKTKLWENEYFYLVFDLYPVSPGHVLIIPKRHVIDLADLNDEEWRNLRAVIKQTIELIEQSDLRTAYQIMLKSPIDEISAWFLEKALNHPKIDEKPDAYNHGVNDGQAAGRTIDHWHWHVIPRYKDDMDDPRGGVRHVIPEMGNYKKLRI